MPTKPKPKKHWFVSQHKLYGYWKLNKDNSGKTIKLRLTREEAAWINTGCKVDFRWVIAAMVDV